MVLEAVNVTKQYKDKKVLNGINISINKGEVYALLGRNGAGKSTFIKLILGLIYADNGNINVYGKKPGINNRIGYLSENLAFYPHLTAIENMKVACYSSNVKMSNEEILNILKRVSLEETGKKKVESFSLGMKRRLQFAMAAMIKDVDFLILDEPTNGLDVNGLLWLKEFLKELRAKGVSILLASHAIFDLQECITDYAIFEKGVIAKQGKWNEANEKTIGVRIELQKEDVNKIKDLLMQKNEQFEFTETILMWYTQLGYKEICELIYSLNIFPNNIEMLKESLESIYLNTIKVNEA